MLETVAVTHRYSLGLPQDELARQSLRGEELGRQNALLHQQMDEMAARSRQPQQQQLDFSFNEEGKTLEQIQEILRYRGVAHTAKGG